MAKLFGHKPYTVYLMINDIQAFPTKYAKANNHSNGYNRVFEDVLNMGKPGKFQCAMSSVDGTSFILMGEGFLIYKASFPLSQGGTIHWIDSHSDVFLSFFFFGGGWSVNQSPVVG